MLGRSYPILRPLLFALPSERAHALALSSLAVAHRLHLLPSAHEDATAAVQLMGLSFPNRIGLAAGFDKNARAIDALGALGFGFVEVGTVTPHPQPGRAQPRLFRLPSERALINRMGFPNDGAAAVAMRLRHRTFRGVLGVNIGKNADTPLEHALDDYVSCYRVLAPLADYIAVNVSSPNTKGLRQLQHAQHLRPILGALMEEGMQLRGNLGRHVPLVAKISPDLTTEELDATAGLLVEAGVDGVIATNTTVTRPFTGTDVIDGRSLSLEEGGLSGEPLLEISLRAIRTLKDASQGRLAIIGVGGVMSAADARRMWQAGADLLQIYTGLIYHGPALIGELRRSATANRQG